MAQVVRADNAIVRGYIEAFTSQYTFPDAIRFVQDGNGNWVTSVENFLNIKYSAIRQDFKKYLKDNGIVTEVDSLKKALETWGVAIEHVAPPTIMI